MQYTSWLASAALFTTSVSAFYPIKAYINSAAEDRRPVPSTPGPERGDIEARTLSIDIQKRPIGWAKRDNKYPVALASEPTLPNSLGINQDGQDYSYFSSIKLGSRSKDVWMLIDSGSANTWVFGSDCSAQACLKHDTFGTVDSDTLNTSSVPWSVTYGTGNVAGVVATDKFSFAGYEIDVGFGLASNASDDFILYPMDGILGLGRASSNKLGTPPFMDVMASNKLLKSNMFGVHLSRSADGATDGQITFGAADTSRFTGDLSYTNAVSTDGLWEIPADGASVDDKGLDLKGKTAIIDTGTSYILMPLPDAQALHAKLPGSANSGEAFTIPCDTTATIQFTFSNVTYDVSPKDYVGKVDKTGKMCASNIVGHQSFGPDTWLLGDVFLKNVYTVFDFDKDRIGFGTKSGGAIGSFAPSSSIAVATSTGKVTYAVSSAAAQATAIGSNQGGSGSPLEGEAVASPARSPLALFAVCFATLLALLVL